MKNQCDGCQAGKPIDKNGNHIMSVGAYRDLMACTKTRYRPAIVIPTRPVEKEK